MLMAAWKIAPALAAGCTMVLKPSEHSPITALIFGEIFHEVGLPRGVVNIVTGGPEVGIMMTQRGHLFDKFAFTGSVATGVKVMKAAAENITNVTLELGGKSPSIVFDSCEMARTIEWVLFGCFWTNGQICSATSRLLLHESIAKPFLEQLVFACETFIIAGDPMDEKTKIGPVICQSQYDKVMGFITRAREAGATILSGGGRPKSVSSGSGSGSKGKNDKGYYIEPTIISDITTDFECWNKEIFGPVLSVITFQNEEEAIQLANDTDFGLAAAVFTTDESQMKRCMRSLRSGMVWGNCSQPAFSQLPWGGFKKSGIGRELGEDALKMYLEPKCCLNYTKDSPLEWYFDKATKLLPSSNL